MSFIMSSEKPYTIGSGEGLGPSSGGQPDSQHQLNNPANDPVYKLGITGSVVGGKGIKPRLDVKSYETKYEAIMAVEKSVEAKNQIAPDFGIPIST